ncbi:hypothetical protein [Bacillus pumilus]|uniref:hypothetical protein n=1 Tax=Bacillus pumilus TaxID=1408 RepID=UPI002FE10BB4
MLDSNIRGLFKRVEYQIANLKGLFSKNEKQMLDNVNEFKKENEEFKDSQKYVLTVHFDDQNNPHKVTKNQIGLDKVDNVKQASEVEFLAHKKDTELHVTADKQKSWDAKETTSGSQSKADAALQKSKDFVSGFQKMKITTDTGMPLLSLKDTSISILDSVINNGLGQGTFYAIAGSKDLPNNRSFRGFFHMTDSTNGKASFGWVYATDYLNNIYTNYLNNSIWSGWKRLLTDQDAITEAEKDKWNNGQLYKLTQDSGTRKLIPEGSDLLTLPPGFYFGINNRLLNNPDPSDTGWFNYDVSESGSGRKMIIAVASYKNTMWFGTVHTNGDFKGWKKVLTVEDVANTTFVDTYDQDNSSVSAAENVATKLNFGATRADDLSEYNRSRSEITLKNNGLYLIRLYITSDNITVGSDNVLSCYVNGVEYQRLGNWSPNNSASTCVLFLQQKFKAGDKVTFYITPKNTGKTIVIATCYVTMSQIR